MERRRPARLEQGGPPRRGVPCSIRASGAAPGWQLTKTGLVTGGEKTRSSYVEPGPLGLVLAALMPENRLVMETMLATGLRVGDVLALTVEQVKKQRFTVKEHKTGKSRRVYIPTKLQLWLLAQAGRLYVFEGRGDWRKHRTRQAVWKDVKRAAQMFQRSGAVGADVNISTHSGRKVYAVEKYRATGSLEATGRALNHTPGDVAVTMLYALSDRLSEKELKALGRSKKKGG